MIKKEREIPEKKHSASFEGFIVRFGRFCAWALLVFIMLYFVSGFGITKSGFIYKWTGGLMHRAISFQIHDYLTIPMAFASICHVLIAVRFAMIRWHVKNMNVLNWVFVGIGVVLFALVTAAYAA
jgi:hypothetical protein